MKRPMQAGVAGVLLLFAGSPLRAQSEAPLAVLAETRFAEPSVGAKSYAGGKELGFTATAPKAKTLGVNNQRQLELRTAAARVEFSPVDLTAARQVEVSIEVAIADAHYNPEDFFQAVVALTGRERRETLTLVRLADAPLNKSRGQNQKFSVKLPEGFDTAQLEVTAFSNSTRDLEAYFIDRVQFSGRLPASPKVTAPPVVAAPANVPDAPVVKAPPPFIASPPLVAAAQPAPSSKGPIESPSDLAPPPVATAPVETAPVAPLAEVQWGDSCSLKECVLRCRPRLIFRCRRCR